MTPREIAERVRRILERLEARLCQAVRERVQ